MCVGIDEPRRHHLPTGLNGAGRRTINLAHCGDSAVLDGDVACVGLLARPVDDQGILHDQVVGHALAPVSCGSFGSFNQNVVERIDATTRLAIAAPSALPRVEPTASPSSRTLASVSRR